MTERIEEVALKAKTPYLKAADVAARLRCSRETAYVLISKHGIRIGGLARIEESALDALVENGRCGTSTNAARPGGLGRQSKGKPSSSRPNAAHAKRPTRSSGDGSPTTLIRPTQPRAFCRSKRVFDRCQD